MGWLVYGCFCFSEDCFLVKFTYFYHIRSKWSVEIKFIFDTNIAHIYCMQFVQVIAVEILTAVPTSSTMRHGVSAQVFFSKALLSLILICHWPTVGTATGMAWDLFTAYVNNYPWISIPVIDHWLACKVQLSATSKASRRLSVMKIFYFMWTASGLSADLMYDITSQFFTAIPCPCT